MSVVCLITLEITFEGSFTGESKETRLFLAFFAVTLGRMKLISWFLWQIKFFRLIYSFYQILNYKKGFRAEKDDKVRGWLVD